MSQGQRALVVTAAVCALGSVVGAARAEELTLTWDAPPGCPTRENALSTVTLLAGKGSLRAISASVHIRQTDTGWLAELTAAGGSRELRGASCLEVARSATVILALAAGGTLDETAASEPATARDGEQRAAPAASSESPTGRESAPVAQPPTPARVVREDDSRTAWQLGAALHLLGEIGILPAPSLGAMGAFRVEHGAPGAELQLRAVLPRSKALATDASRGGDFGWQSLALAATYRVAEPWALALGFEAGRLTGEGFGVDHHVLAVGTWLAPSAGVTVRLLTTRHFALEGAANVAIALLRPRFGLDAHGTVHRPAAASGRLELGIGWR